MPQSLQVCPALSLALKRRLAVLSQDKEKASNTSVDSEAPAMDVKQSSIEQIAEEIIKNQGFGQRKVVDSESGLYDPGLTTVVLADAVFMDIAHRMATSHIYHDPVSSLVSHVNAELSKRGSSLSLEATTDGGWDSGGGFLMPMLESMRESYYFAILDSATGLKKEEIHLDVKGGKSAVHRTSANTNNKATSSDSENDGRKPAEPQLPK